MYCCSDHSGLQDQPELIRRYGESGGVVGNAIPNKSCGMGTEQTQTAGAVLDGLHSLKRPDCQHTPSDSSYEGWPQF